MMIQCLGCGNRYPDGTKYCNGCGRVVDIKPSIISPISKSSLTASQLEHQEFLLGYRRESLRQRNTPPRILISKEEYQKKCQVYEDKIKELKQADKWLKPLFYLGMVFVWLGLVDMVFIWIGGIMWGCMFISVVILGGEGVHPSKEYTDNPKYENIIKETGSLWGVEALSWR